MRFRLFGVPITIRGWFWITAVLFSLGSVQRVGVWALPIWVASMLASLVVHEMGHALAIRRHGLSCAITLHAMGGVTTSNDARLGRLDRALIDLAGPAAGLVVGGLIYLGAGFVPLDAPLPVKFTVDVLLFMNIAWSLFNLVPVLPFDGGHVLEQALGPRRARTTYQVSLVFAVLLAGVGALLNQPFVAVMFVISAIQSYQRLTLPPGAVLVDPFTSPAGATGATGAAGAASAGPSPLRRWWLQRKLARLEGEAAALRSDKPARRRAGGPELRVIQGGRADPPKDKRTLN